MWGAKTSMKKWDPIKCVVGYYHPRNPFLIGLNLDEKVRVQSLCLPLPMISSQKVGERLEPRGLMGVLTFKHMLLTKNFKGLTALDNNFVFTGA